jgi:hypothetical protein
MNGRGILPHVVQAGLTHTAHSYTQAGVNPALSSNGSVSTTLIRFENPAYSLYDASAGVARNAWSADLYAQNLTNVNASVFTSTTHPFRPRPSRGRGSWASRSAISSKKTDGH